jgi:hypothetical protein
MIACLAAMRDLKFVRNEMMEANSDRGLLTTEDIRAIASKPEAARVVPILAVVS